MFILIFMFSMLSSAYAESKPALVNKVLKNNPANYQVVNIYVDLSVVIAPDGSKGTSNSLNQLVSHYAQIDSMLIWKMNRHTGASTWDGEVNVYDWTNVTYMPGFKRCDYSNALKCGVENKHWTLTTFVTVGKKYSIFTQKLYNENGRIIAQATQTAWGTVRWKPQWKLTRIKEQGPFGGGSKEIFEMWPPVMEELPPLIKPYHVSQARHGVYAVDKRACTVKACQD